VLFHTLAGGPPYQRGSDEATLWAHLNDDPPSLRVNAPGAPPALQAVIDRALAKDPDERFQSAGDLGRAALAAVGRESGVRRERVVARGAAAPVDAETAASPDQAPTVLAEPAAPRRGGRRPAWVWALAALPVLGLAAVAAIALSNGGGGGGATSSSATGDTRTTPTGAGAPDTAIAGTVRRTVRVGGRPNGVVVAGGLVWVLRARSDRLTVLRQTGKRTPFHPTVGPLPAAAAAASGRLWVGVQRTSSVVAVGLRSHKPVGPPIVIPAGSASPVGVAAGERGVWVGMRGNPGLAVRISPSRRTIIKTVAMPDGLQDLAVGSGAVWVLGRRSNTVTRVDIATGRESTINVGRNPAGVAVGEGAVWVTNSGDDTVTRIDAGSLNTTQIGVGDAPNRIAIGGGAVWVANRNDSTLTRIDPRTGRRVGNAVEVGANPFGLDVTGHQVWVTSPPDGTVQRIDF
jgi:YVTN family beta-propeller protein